MLNKIRQWVLARLGAYDDNTYQPVDFAWEMLRTPEGNMNFRCVHFIDRIVVLKPDGTIELSDALREVQLIERLAGLND